MTEKLSEWAKITLLTAELEATRSEARALRSALDTSVALHAKARAALAEAIEYVCLDSEAPPMLSKWKAVVNEVST